MNPYDVLIVGAGHGGAQAAIALRQKGFAGTIAIVSDEMDVPYERPPLSKEFLSGEKPFERIHIRPPSFWREKGIDLLVGRRISTIDSAAHIARTEKGDALGYRSLIWAAGGLPRRLPCPGSELEGIHSIRNRIDVDRLRMDMASSGHTVIVGGGYIGLEAAATLSKLGKSVTLVEALDRVLARVAGEPISHFYQAEHRRHGVKLRLGETVEQLNGVNGRVASIRLKDGETLPADLVIVGIGIVPTVEPLIDAGATGRNGVNVDEYCRTNLPDVYSVGDCAAHRNAFADNHWVRLESVQNATDQANVAVASILGAAQPYRAVPWFWSNQYDLKLQTVGVSVGYNEVVTRGDPTTRSFSVVYLKNGTVIALDCVNASKDYAQGRALVVNRARPDRAALRDCNISLRTLAGSPVQDDIC
jgi:3-phenylpropionate/trans-cinnamate dioxygenase ferredoxin reductase subunit